MLHLDISELTFRIEIHERFKVPILKDTFATRKRCESYDYLFLVPPWNGEKGNLNFNVTTLNLKMFLLRQARCNINGMGVWTDLLFPLSSSFLFLFCFLTESLWKFWRYTNWKVKSTLDNLEPTTWMIQVLERTT